MKLVIAATGASGAIYLQRLLEQIDCKAHEVHLVMSAYATPTRVADGLDAGADDYIARPFDPAELAARVPSLVRRRGSRLHAGRREVGSTIVDLDARTITRDGRSISLTRPEWALLAQLLHNEGRIMLREELLSAAFGAAAHDDPSLLRLSIGRLRRKLGLAPWDEGPIRTIHGLGYAFDPDGVVPLSWSGRRGMAVAADEAPADPGPAPAPVRSEPGTKKGARLAASASLSTD